MIRSFLKRGPERLSIEIGGREVPVVVKRNARARRLILRLDAASGLPVVTLPTRTSLSHGERFVHKHVDWLESRLARGRDDVPFKGGQVFPLRGEACRIHHRGGRGLVRLDCIDGHAELSVPGDAEHLARRVNDWLKREARRDLGAAVSRFAGMLDRPAAAIRIGDAKSRWGSCTTGGVLTFSWRLILAPPHVLDYLAAHEVAHLAEMNHGARFWALVRRLDPDCQAARAWLKQHGAGLHAIGRDAA